MTFDPVALTRRTTFINGGWEAGEGKRGSSTDPSRGAVIAEYPVSSPRQVDAAVAAARSSFDAGVWRSLPAEERAEVLRRLADLVEADFEDLARLIVTEIGSPIELARSLQVGQPVANLRWSAELAVRGPRGGYAERLPRSTGSAPAESELRREPIGVVAAIVPYNYPLNLITWKLGPALAAGCSVVLLPSPRGTLTALAFMSLVEQLGLPPGVVNLVTGDAEISRALAAHPMVDMVSFTGSSAVGSTIMELAAPTVKKVVLELGGKSPNVILPGADLSHVVAPSVLRFCRNAGQGCGVTSRILVHRSQVDEFVDRAATVLRELAIVGDPHEERTVLGPLISEAHREAVEGFLLRGMEAGGRVLAGGGRPDRPDGYFLNPVLFGGVSNDAEICQQELFAPVAVLLPYDTVDEAVELANGTSYALNAAVWGPLEDALAVAARLQSGTVAVNGGGDARPDAPWGGGKLSGVGVEMGEDGFAEFFAVKHVQWPAD